MMLVSTCTATAETAQNHELEVAQHIYNKTQGTKSTTQVLLSHKSTIATDARGGEIETRHVLKSVKTCPNFMLDEMTTLIAAQELHDTVVNSRDVAQQQQKPPLPPPPAARTTHGPWWWRMRTTPRGVRRPAARRSTTTTVGLVDWRHLRDQIDHKNSKRPSIASLLPDPPSSLLAGLEWIDEEEDEDSDENEDDIIALAR